VLSNTLRRRIVRSKQGRICSIKLPRIRPATLFPYTILLPHSILVGTNGHQGTNYRHFSPYSYKHTLVLIKEIGNHMRLIRITGWAKYKRLILPLRLC
jgi:hypothetical protein